MKAAFLTGANLAGANLAHANLDKSRLKWTNLTGANLTGSKLRFAKLVGADLTGANLSESRLANSDLTKADLTNAVLHRAHLSSANLTRARLTRAVLTEANLTEANLTEANLTDANLTEANLTRAILVKTTVAGSSLSRAKVYGASVWDLAGDPADEQDLVVTPSSDAAVTVDKLKVVQFIYLLLSNKEIRDVIETITTKTVLILGRFTPGRKLILDTLRTELRERYNYLPIVVDFDKPTNRSLTDTVRLLAGLSRFVIIDLSDAMSSNYELGVLTQLGLHRTPMAIIAEAGLPTMSMLPDVLALRPVLENLHEYTDLDHLSATLADAVVGPAEARWSELNPSPT